MGRGPFGKLPAHARDILDAGDLVQETFLKVTKFLYGFEARHDEAIQAYLRPVLKNRLRDLWRQAPMRPAVDTYQVLSPDGLAGQVAAERYDRFHGPQTRALGSDRDGGH